MTLHIRTPSGMRIESTEERFVKIEKVVKQTMPGKVDLISTTSACPRSTTISRSATDPSSATTTARC